MSGRAVVPVGATNGASDNSSGSQKSLVHASQIVAGVVIKYVNFALGWRTRLLVLQGDTIRYWKLQGEGAVDVHRLFQALRAEGDLQVLGLEAVALERRWQKLASSGGGSSGGGGRRLKLWRGERFL